MKRSLSTVLLLASACGGASAAPAHPEPTPEPEPVAAADPHGEAVVARIEAIETPLLAEWEPLVRDILLEAYDADRSGRLDTRDEADAVPCPVWQVVNREYGERVAGEESIRSAYGFAPERFFLDVLGIDRNQREHLRVDLLDCGVR